MKNNIIKFRDYTSEIVYSDLLSNIEIVKDKSLYDKLMKLSINDIEGGIKAVWKYAKENPSDVIIAYKGNEPIGVVTHTNGRFNIFVEPNYRKRGIGRKLNRLIRKHLYQL